MNLSISFANPNGDTLLLLGGVLLLLINVVYGIIRARRNQLKAGGFTVVVMLMACILVTVGIVGFSTQPRQAAGSNRFNRGGFGQNGQNTSSQTGFNPTGQNQNVDQPTGSQVNLADPPATALPDGTGDSGQLVSRFSANLSPSIQAMFANGQGPEAVQTLAASGIQVPAPIMTAVAGDQTNPSASGSGGSQAPAGFAPPAGFQAPSNPAASTSAQTNSSSSGSGAPAGFAPPAGFQAPAGSIPETNANSTGSSPFPGQNGASSQTTPTIPANLVGNMLAGVGGVLVFFGGLYLYYYERRKPGFVKSASRGLLNAGAGFFIVFSAIVVPTLPASISGSSSSTQIQLVVNTTIEPRAGLPSPTPTIAPSATAIPTELPTLSPTPTEGTLVLATQIAYPHALPTALSDCQVTTTALVNLRGDPSTNVMAIGRVQAGSIVVVTDQSADNQWLHITYNDGSVTLDGWISAKYTTVLTGCDPLLSASGTPMATSSP